MLLNSEDTPQEVVFAIILELYPTTQVEQNLSEDARLTEDLGLTSGQVLLLALTIEKHYQSFGEMHMPDEDILSWITCNDIINTITILLQSGL